MLVVPTGAPITIANEAIGTSPLAADKTNKALSVIFNNAVIYVVSVTHYFSFTNFSKKIVFYFISLINSKMHAII